MTPTRVAGLLWLIAGAAYVVCEAVAAARFPGYSFVRDYISDLGVPALSPAASTMNVGAFIANGLLFAAAAVVAVRATGRRDGVALVFVAAGLANGVGNVLVGLVHSGAGPLHGIGAALAIIGGNTAVILAGSLFAQIGAPHWFLVATRLAGVLGIVSVLVLVAVANRTDLPDGAFERGSVYSIIAFDIVAGLVLLTATRGRPGGDRRVVRDRGV